MNTEFSNIALVGRHEDIRVAEPMRAVTEHLAKAGINVFASDRVDLDIALTRVPESRLCENADLVIAIGGDGTMLYASRLARESATPILGINRGRLGFLSDITPDEMISSVDQVLLGEYTRDARMLLEARLIEENGEETVAYALNDVVLKRRETGRMVDFSTQVDGTFVNTHSGDGLIVSTPTGSTAYSLSCGGPIISPQIDAVVVVPVCPHTLTDRPLVVQADRTIEVLLREREETTASITVDGRTMGRIRPADRLVISKSSHRITLIHPPGYDFYGILRSKLFWGRDSRKRD